MWKKIWKIRVPERVKMLIWRIATNTIPVKEVLGQRVELDSQECVLCQDGQESISHLFFIVLWLEQFGFLLARV